jgi:ribosome biogenesis GTPase / thiamine phosphate phosphatase
MGTVSPAPGPGLDPALVALGADARVEAWVAGWPANASDRPLGRVVRLDVEACVVGTANGAVRARVRGKIRKSGGVVAGDWVRLDGGARDEWSIEDLAPRWTWIARRDPRGLTQVLAANVDLVFVAAPADRMSLSRVEREVAIAWDGGATPVVLLTKADLDDSDAVNRLRERLVGVDVLRISSLVGEGVDLVRALLQPSRTAVLLGPSGAGKSTLVNALLGYDAAATGTVREGDHRGRHVTTSREIHLVPTGGVLVDTPGLRSLSLAPDHGGVAAAFPDIEDLAADCKFGDCGHSNEPGCAVREAVEAGELDAERFANYLKLQSDLDVETRRDDPAAAREAKAAARTQSRAIKRFKKDRGH